jgi:hypothetical protein
MNAQWRKPQVINFFKKCCPNATSRHKQPVVHSLRRKRGRNSRCRAPDGSFNRIYSKFTQSVAFPDQQGIAKSQTIAEEKAKAAIIRFINQQVAAARVTTEIQNDMNNSTRTRADGKDEITKPSQRQMTENPDGSRVTGRRRPPARRDRA